MRKHDVHALIAAVAASQFGVFSRAQAFACGATDRMVTRSLQSGSWMKAGVGVYALPGVATSYEQRLWIAHLAIGPRSWVSHEAAAALHGLVGFPKSRVVLSAPHGAHPRPGVVVHETRDVMQKNWFVQMHGLRTTSVARTIVDLAGRTHPARLAAVLDDSTAAKKTSNNEVGGCLAAVARPGKPGVRKLARILEARGPGYVPPQSHLEREFLELLEAYGEPLPIRQMPFPGRRLPNGCADFGYGPEMFIIETDGRRWHTRIADIRRDHDRDGEAARHGWLVHRVLYEMVRDDPEGTVATIREIRLIRSPRGFARRDESGLLVPEHLTTR